MERVPGGVHSEPDKYNLVLKHTTYPWPARRAGERNRSEKLAVMHFHPASGNPTKISERQMGRIYGRIILL